MNWQLITYISVAVAAASLLGFGGWKSWQFWRKLSARPKKYFLRYLTDAQKEILQSAGIEILNGSAPDGAAGVLIKYELLPAVLAALNATNTASLPLNGKELHEAVLAFPHAAAADTDAARITVWFSRRDKLVTERVQRVVHSVLGGRMDKTFSVSLDAGQYTRNDYQSQFRICFGSSPKAGTREHLPARLFDIDLTGQNVYGYAATGAPVTDPTSGHVVGEMTKNTLFIYADFWQMGEEQRLALLTRVLQRLLVERDPAAFLKEVIAEESAGLPAPAARQKIADEGFEEAETRAIVRSTLHRFLSPYLHQEIHVKNCEGRVQRPLNDGLFHVFFNASPVGSPVEDPPKKLFGLDLLCTEKAFGPSGFGKPLFTEDGFIYAELVGSNLYVHQYLLKHSSKMEAKLLARLFVKAGKLVEKLEARQGGPNFTEEDLQEELAIVAASVNGGSRKVKEPVSEQELSKALREAVNTDTAVFRMEQSGSEELGREFDELCRVHKVLSVEVKQKSIVLMTDLLYCVDPRTDVRHEIGAFKITIPMDAEHEVTWLNQTRTIRVDGRTMHAPHVSSHGHACLGNTQDLFPMLIEKREFSHAAQLAIAFVESVNTSDSWGKCIELFPEAVGNE